MKAIFSEQGLNWPRQKTTFVDGWLIRPFCRWFQPFITVKSEQNILWDVCLCTYCINHQDIQRSSHIWRSLGDFDMFLHCDRGCPNIHWHPAHNYLLSNRSCIHIWWTQEEFDMFLRSDRGFSGIHWHPALLFAWSTTSRRLNVTGEVTQRP